MESREQKLNNQINDSLAIKAIDVSVRYRHDHDRPHSLKEFAIRRLTQKTEQKWILALDMVSLEVNRGEVFGIIGRNGAGKSTFLKVVSKILRPTHGRVQLWGESSSLLGIGSGFHNELSGRENIFLYSSILGRSMGETNELFQSIVEFSEIEDFIDSPLRTYSTGMVARLGFAIAMAKRPDNLLVDEVLSVGDVAFREKCSKRFREFREQGSTILIVSHSMATVQSLCDRAVWLHKGKINAQGNSDIVVEAYRTFVA
jgi:ABC-type polysaccharide/polyol phosphate transport system ATPase subunit